MGLFEKQETLQQLKEAERFHREESKWIEENNIKRVRKNYLQQKFFQYITEQYIYNIDYNIKYEKIEWLFGKAIDILIRHLLTQGAIIKEDSETKSEYYNASIDRIYRLGIKSYDSTKGTAFVHFTTIINNEFKQQFKNDIIRKSLAYKQKNQIGIGGHFTNMDEKEKSYMREDYKIKNTNNDSFNENLPPFIIELREKYNVEDVKIIEDVNAPKFKRKYLNFDNAIKVNESYVIVEYIDLYLINEDNGYTKDYLTNRMKYVRDRGYQYFAIYSDIYLDKNLDDIHIWSKLKQMIDDMKSNNTPSPIDLQRNTWNPSLQFIPKEFWDNGKMKAPLWYSIDENRYNRIVQFDQSPEGYIKLLDKYPKFTRLYDYSMLTF